MPTGYNPNAQRDRRRFIGRILAYAIIGGLTFGYAYTHHEGPEDVRGPRAVAALVAWPIYWPARLTLLVTRSWP